MPYSNGKKTFAELDLQERWEWHSQVYAWRFLTFDTPIAKGSAPTDPNGEWFDERMIQVELGKLQRPKPLDPAGEEHRREGRAACNEWAHARGFVDFAAAERAGHTIADVIRSIGIAKRIPGDDDAPEYDLANLQRDLGLGAKEYQPTADQMRDGRTALGIAEPTEPVFIEPEPERKANA